MGYCAVGGGVSDVMHKPGKDGSTLRPEGHPGSPAIRPGRKPRGVSMREEKGRKRGRVGALITMLHG